MTPCHAHVATMLRPGDPAYEAVARVPQTANERRAARRLAALGGITKRVDARQVVLCEALVPDSAERCPSCDSEAPRLKAERGAERIAGFFEECRREEDALAKGGEAL